jgi:hypothetical protein
MTQRLAPTLAAALVGYGIAAALVTLPVWAWVLGTVVSGVGAG